MKQINQELDEQRRAEKRAVEAQKNKKQKAEKEAKLEVLKRSKYSLLKNEKVRTDMNEERNDFIDIFVNLLEKHLALVFPKQRDIQVADTVLYLFKNREHIENYNKKAIYILVRERTGANSQNITGVISKIKAIYGSLYKEYRENISIEDLSWYELQDIINN